MANIPKKVKDRLVREVARFKKILENASDRDVNESDTVTIVTDMLAAVFGFDKYTEVTSEQAIRGTYCDLAVCLDGKMKYLIEVKAIGLTLKENHLRQVVNYGANHGIPWVVLTNGLTWDIYRIRFEQPIAWDHLCSFNFLDVNPRQQEDLERLYILCRDGVVKAAIDAFHDHTRNVNRFVIGAIVASDAVVNVVRREIRKISPGIKVTPDEIGRILESEVLKRDVVEGDAADDAKVRIRKVAAAIKRRKAQSSGVARAQEDGGKEG